MEQEKNITLIYDLTKQSSPQTLKNEKVIHWTCPNCGFIKHQEEELEESCEISINEEDLSDIVNSYLNSS